MSVIDRLAAAGIVLPVPPTPKAHYVPTVRTGDRLYVAGQVPFVDGALFSTGAVPEPVSIERAQQAANHAAVNVLAHLQVALDGDLDRVVRAVQLTGYVVVQPGFDRVHEVVNGASDLLATAFGARGHHARSAVGVVGLPIGSTVMVDAVFEVA